MTTFSPDCRSLLRLHLSLYVIKKSTFLLNINLAEQLTFRVDVLEKSSVTWEFESRSKGGFLLGDPLSCVSVGKEFGSSGLSVKFDFVLDKNTVLRSDYDRVEMLKINEQQEDEKEAAHIFVEHIVFP